MIGLSLSFCVADILSNRVSEAAVTKIVTNTKVASDGDWDRLIAQYQLSYWRNFNANDIRGLIARLRQQGKIEQPRLNDPEYQHSINNGCWIKDID